MIYWKSRGCFSCTTLKIRHFNAVLPLRETHFCFLSFHFVCRSHERTQEELELVFEELLHIPALSHLSTSIKRELASIIVFESHAQAGTVCELNPKFRLLYWFSLPIQFIALHLFFRCFSFFFRTMHVQEVKYYYDSRERTRREKKRFIFLHFGFGFSVGPWKIIIPFMGCFEKPNNILCLTPLRCCSHFHSKEKFKANNLVMISFYRSCSMHHSCMLNGFCISCRTIFISHLKDIDSISFCI